MSIAVDTACLLKGKMATSFRCVSKLCDVKHNMQEIFNYDNAMYLVLVSYSISHCNCPFWGGKNLAMQEMECMFEIM